MSTCPESNTTEAGSGVIPPNAIRLAPAPSYIRFGVSPPLLDSDGFYFATVNNQNDNSPFRGILKYSFHSDSWLQWIPYRTDCNIDHLRVCVEPKPSRLYIHGRHGWMSVLDLIERQCSTLYLDSLPDDVDESYNTGRVIMVNEVIYFFASFAQRYCVWNPESREISCREGFKSMNIECAVYLKTEHSILIMSLSQDNNQISFWIWSLEDDTFTDKGTFDTIFDSVSDAILAVDENYIIIVGELDNEHGDAIYDDGDKNGDVIYVLDCGGDEYQFSKCDIDLAGTYHVAASFGGITEQVVGGYIRGVYSSTIPKEIVELVALWCRNQMIHFFEFNRDSQKTKEHFAIAVDDILSNCSLSQKKQNKAPE